MDQVEANCKRGRADILAKKSTAQNSLSSNDRLLNVDIKKKGVVDDDGCTWKCKRLGASFWQK